MGEYRVEYRCMWKEVTRERSGPENDAKRRSWTWAVGPWVGRGEEDDLRSFMHYERFDLAVI